MIISLNGEQKTVEPDLTLAQLIEQLGLTGKRLAAEINHEIIPRSAHSSHVLKDGDVLEIVHAIGGGWASKDYDFERPAKKSGWITPWIGTWSNFPSGKTALIITKLNN